MADMNKAIATQISNIEKKTGKSLAELRAAIGGCGKAKHGEIRSWLMETYGLGHGDANTLTHVAKASDGYVSLRRKTQFAMLGPKTNDRFELGLNIKGEVKDPRAKALPPGGMCQYVVPLTSADEVDTKLIAIVRKAFDGAA